MKTINATDWVEVKPNVQLQSPEGRLWLRATASVAVLVEQEGVEALLEPASSIDLRAAGRTPFQVIADKGVRVWMYDPARSISEGDPEKYTNLDRQPHESGAMSDTLAALRRLQIAERQTLARIRDAEGRARAASAPAKEPEVIEAEKPEGDADAVAP